MIIFDFSMQELVFRIVHNVDGKSTNRQLTRWLMLLWHFLKELRFRFLHLLSVDERVNM